MLFRKLRIIWRLILYFSLLLIIQMLFIGWFSYSWVSNNLKTTYINNMYGIDSSATQQINTIRHYYEELSDRYLANMTIQNLLVENISLTANTRFIINKADIDNELFDPTDTIYCVIVQNNGALYYPGSGAYNSTTIDVVKNSTAYAKSLQSHGNNLWVSANDNMNSGVKEPYLYVCRTYRSVLLRKWPALGQFVMQIPMEVLGSTFAKINMVNGEYYEVVDSKGVYIYSTKSIDYFNGQIDSGLMSSLNGPAGNFTKMIEKEEYLITYSITQGNGWSIVHYLPMKVISSAAVRMRNYILLIMLLSLVALFPLFILMSRSISQPIRKLKSVVDEFGSGNLSVREETERLDEIGHLQMSYNKMADDINSLLAKVNDDNKQKTLLELNMLEYQINPHFLYNSLDSVNWLAKSAGNKEIEELVGALAKYLRVGLSKGKEIYKVKDELEHIQQYLLINKIRYRDCFQFEIRANGEVLDCPTIKILLQPIVENAIKYGIDKKKTNGFILVTAVKEEHAVLLQVSDNGPGIPNERLQAIRRILADHTQLDLDSDSGFGLYNVNQRIWLHYGEGYGIIVESDAGIGTTVSVKLPLLNVYKFV